MPKSRQPRKKTGSGSGLTANEKIARNWRKSEESERAWDRFHDAVFDLVDGGRMGKDRLTAIAQHLDKEEFLIFVEDVEGIAANKVLGFVKDGDNEIPVRARLFGIPVSGSVADMESELPSRSQEVATALRATGLSPERSNIAIIPIPLQMISLSMMEPSTLSDITRAAGKALLFGSDRKMVEDQRRIASELVRELVPDQLDEARGQENGMVGHRILLGVEVTFAPDDPEWDDEPSLIFSDGYGDENEDEHDASDAELDFAIEQWNEILNPLEGDLSYRVGSPTPWSELRLGVLVEHLDFNIDLAKAVGAGKGYFDEVTGLNIRFSQEGLDIEAVSGHHSMTRMTIPGEVLGIAVKEFLDYLHEAYTVTIVDEASPGSLPH